MVGVRVMVRVAVGARVMVELTLMSLSTGMRSRTTCVHLKAV